MEIVIILILVVLNNNNNCLSNKINKEEKEIIKIRLFKKKIKKEVIIIWM